MLMKMHKEQADNYVVKYNSTNTDGFNDVITIASCAVVSTAASLDQKIK